MKIGYACTPLGVSYKTSKRFLLKNYSHSLMYECIDSNLNNLLSILKYNVKNNITMFRISSDIIPFGSHEINTFDFEKEFSEKLSLIGDFVKKNNIRLSMHPGQYTVLNSPSPSIISNSVSELIYHAKFLDALNMDKTNKLILHIGGIYGDKNEAIKRFISSSKALPSIVKDRLTIENDERSYSLNDLAYISSKTSFPVIFDNLHFFCMEGYHSIYDSLSLAFSTWSLKDGLPKVHYSEQNPFKKTGSHSQTIHMNNISTYLKEAKNLDFDIMTEVKDKDFSAIKINNLLNPTYSKEKEFEKFKYVLLEDSNETLNLGKDLLFNKDFFDFYSLIDSLEFKEKPLKNTLSCSKELIKNFTSLKPSESSHLNKLYKEENINKLKEYLITLGTRYNLDILQNYFLYI